MAEVVRGTDEGIRSLKQYLAVIQVPVTGPQFDDPPFEVIGNGAVTYHSP